MYYVNRERGKQRTVAYYIVTGDSTTKCQLAASRSVDRPVVTQYVKAKCVRQRRAIVLVAMPRGTRQRPTHLRRPQTHCRRYR